LAVDEANAARLAGQHLRCKWRLHIGGRGDLVGPFEVVASTVTDVGADSSFFTIAAGDPTVGPLSTSNGGTLLGEWVPAPASLQSPSLEVRFDRFPLPASRSGRCNFSVEDLGTGTVLGTSTATAYSGFPPCIDGVDNDGDGRSDYPNDPGCADPNDNDETDDCPNGSNCPECSNEIDDDNFGDIDFPADPECDWAADDDEGPRTACSNGIDDDGDAKTDWPSDPGCNSPADNDEGDG
jgi:hypothetical protein